MGWGILGDIADAAKSAVGAVADVVKDVVVDPVVHVAEGAAHVFSDVGGGLFHAAGHIAQGKFGSALGDLVEIPGKVFGDAVHTAGELIQDAGDIGGHVPIVGGALGQLGHSVGGLVESAGTAIHSVDDTNLFGDLLDKPLKDIVFDPIMTVSEFGMDAVKHVGEGLWDAAVHITEGKGGSAILDLASIPLEIMGEGVEGLGELVTNFGEIMGDTMPVGGGLLEGLLGKAGGAMEYLGHETVAGVEEGKPEMGAWLDGILDGDFLKGDAISQTTHEFHNVPDMHHMQ